MPCLGQNHTLSSGTSPSRPYKGVHYPGQKDASTDTKNAFISLKKVQLHCHKQVFPERKRITELHLLLQISYKRQLNTKLLFKKFDT